MIGTPSSTLYEPARRRLNRYALVGLLALLLAVGAAFGKKEVPLLADNKAIIRRSHEEVWSKGNLIVVDELYAPNFVCHFVVGPEWRGPEGVKQEVTRHRRSFPDWNEYVEDIIAEGDMVVTRFTSSGTHKGELAGIAPTGKQVKVSEVAIYRIADGKIVEQWGNSRPPGHAATTACGIPRRASQRISCRNVGLAILPVTA